MKTVGRRDLIKAAPWTEIFLVHPALDAIREGFEVHHGVDCVAGRSLEAHEAGVRRVKQAGGNPSVNKCSDGTIHLAFIHGFSKFAENGQIDKRLINAMGEVLTGCA